MNTRAKGIDGEKLASDYLVKKGYNIKELNYDNKLGEIDIVAMDGNILVFIEVKLRTSKAFGTPSEAVNYYRQKRYINSAKSYIVKNRLANTDIRFDVIEIFNDTINHIEDAFRG